MLYSITRAFVVSLTLIASASNAATSNECTFTWSMTAYKMSLGRIVDTVSWSSDKVAVSSVFTPSSTATFLGAPVITRLFESSARSGLSRREEFHTKGGAEVDYTLWTSQNNQLRFSSQRSSLGSVQEMPSASVYIDSTSLPYLDLSEDGLTDGAFKRAVLNQKEPYTASLIKSGNVLEYRSGQKRGRVWLENKRPVRMAFSDGKDSFEGHVVSWECGVPK